MKHLHTFIGLFTLFLFASCSSTGSSVSMDETTSESLFPDWYSAQVLQDSTQFIASATAISFDSLTAIRRAETEAKSILEVEIGNLTEEIRLKGEEEGVSAFSNTDFKIILRTAHASLQNNAERVQVQAKKINTQYRAFVNVRLTKTQVQTLLENGFEGHPRYWNAFSSSNLFLTFF
jgi:hypothetical protein